MRVRKKYVSCFAVILLCIILSSCGGKSHDETASKTTETTGIVPTEEELLLLAGRYAGEERIRRGDLKSYEIEAIIDLREGMAYLDEKYPGFEFMPLALGPMNVWQPLTEIRVRCDGNEDFTLKVKRESDGSRKCSDDFRM